MQWRIHIVQLLLFAVCATVFLPGYIAPLERLSKNGVPVVATVTGLYADQSSKAQIGYKYFVHGKAYTGNVPFESSMIACVKAGSRITIYTLPTDPSVHHFGPVTVAFLNQENEILLVAKLAFVPLLVLFALLEVRMYRQRCLLKRGPVSQARVASIEHRALWWYNVRCTSTTAPTALAWELCLPIWRAAEMPVGSSITILYDSDCSANAIPYDRRLYVEVFEPELGLWLRVQRMVATWRIAGRDSSRSGVSYAGNRNHSL